MTVWLKSVLTSESPPSAATEPAAAPRRSGLATNRRSGSRLWLFGLLLLLIWGGLADDSFRLIPPPLTGQLDLGIVLGGLTVGDGEALPGVYGLDYEIPTTAQLDYFRRHGLNLVCLNVQWERLQSSPFGPLDAAEVDRIRRFVRQAWARDQRVVVALYGYGRYNPSPTVWAGTYLGWPLGSPELPAAALPDLWVKLATALRGTPGLYGYSLMNEPHHLQVAWVDVAQQAIDAIRSVDTATYVMVPGYDWSNTRYWWENNADLYQVHDRVDRTVFIAHAYPDQDNDAKSTTCWDYDAERAYPTVYVDRIKPFVDWLRLHGKKGYLGELAVPAAAGCVPTDVRWLVVLERALEYLRQNADVVPLATYFVAGPRVSGELSVEAVHFDRPDRPQMHVLRRYGSESPSGAGRFLVQEAYTDHAEVDRGWTEAGWKSSLVELRRTMMVRELGFAGGPGAYWELRYSTSRGEWGELIAAGRLSGASAEGYFLAELPPMILDPGYYSFHVYADRSHYGFGNVAKHYDDVVFHKSSSGTTDVAEADGTYQIRLVYEPVS